MSAPLAAVIACTMLLTLSLEYLYRNYAGKVVRWIARQLGARRSLARKMPLPRNGR